MSCAFIFAISPWHAMKRFATRAALLMVPVLGLYVAAGWNARGKVFAPVQKVRSILAPAADTEEEANVERDIENYNITKSWEQNMFLGQGFGHAFREFTPSNDFSQSRFGHIGHNSVLWLLWIGGVVGFTGVLIYLAVVAYLIARTLRCADEVEERVALLVSLSIILTFLMQAFGDMGLLFDAVRLLCRRQRSPSPAICRLATRFWLRLLGRLTSTAGSLPWPLAGNRCEHAHSTFLILSEIASSSPGVLMKNAKQYQPVG